MTTITRSVRGERTYYYLTHTYRWAGKVGKTQRYLGETVPSNIADLKLDVEREAWSRTWFPEFDRIRRGYQGRLHRLPDEVVERELHDFVLDFTYDTNRIEGSTLSSEDTSGIVDHGVSPSSKPLSDILEAQAHARLAQKLLTNPRPFGLPELLGWHSALFKPTKPGIAGRIRDYEVRIRGSKHGPPSALEVRPMLKELLRWARRSAKTVHRVELSATFHWRFESIHPFGDGNGRIGRLAMNVLLAEAGYPPLNVQYAKRRGYYHALERADSLESAGPFIAWLFRRYLAMNSRLAGAR